MTKQKRAVMLEFIDDSNNWAWYSVLITKTPRQAIISYLIDCGYIDDEKETKIKQDTDGIWYDEKNEDIRAYYINLE